MNQQDIFITIISTSLTILVLVGIMAIAFVISARRKLHQEILLAQTKLDYEQELRQMESEVTEELMSRFAQELHDNIGQLHTAMHIRIQNQKIDHPELIDKFEVIESYLGEATRQLKILSRTLNYDYLGHAGLLHTIELEVERLRNLKRCTVNYNREGTVSNLNKNQELVVFRILQEILQNAIRHSGANTIAISLNCSENRFELSIEDNGKGFDTNAILRHASTNGIRNMFKRAEMAGVKLDLNSKPGEGTVYRIKKISNLEM
ncbi:MAG TPA: ATP-binding protein [Bacteroidia bacterium]|nr:ATP-binding protein [Bacteroidia bacterium]